MSRGGRRHGRPHLPVESCHSLSAWGRFVYAQMWENDDAFAVEWTFDSDRAVVGFTRDGCRWSESIRLTWTPCRYGGRRRWFLCPSCGRRVAKVYLPCTAYIGSQRVVLFQCRLCYGLTYEERQSRDRFWPCTHRAERIAGRWFAGVTDDVIYRRKWSHRVVFEKRLRKYEALQERANDAFWGKSKIGKIVK